MFLFVELYVYIIRIICIYVRFQAIFSLKSENIFNFLRNFWLKIIQTGIILRNFWLKIIQNTSQSYQRLQRFQASFYPKFTFTTFSSSIVSFAVKGIFVIPFSCSHFFSICLYKSKSLVSKTFLYSFK